MPLNDKQKRFVAEYLIDQNATAAYIRAGYKDTPAAQANAARLIGNDMIRAEIDAGMKKLTAKIEVTAEKILQELAKIGFANMSDYLQATSGGDPYFDYSKLTRDQSAALQEVTVEDYVEGRGDDARQVKRVKFRLADKRAALVDLGKSKFFNLFPSSVTVKGDKDNPVQVEHKIKLPDVTSDEYKALPADERLRRLRESINSVGSN